jgi:hypothetical protein
MDGQVSKVLVGKKSKQQAQSANHEAAHEQLASVETQEFAEAQVWEDQIGFAPAPRLFLGVRQEWEK